MELCFKQFAFTFAQSSVCWAYVQYYLPTAFIVSREITGQSRYQRYQVDDSRPSPSQNHEVRT